MSMSLFILTEHVFLSSSSLIRQRRQSTQLKSRCQCPFSNTTYIADTTLLSADTTVLTTKVNRTRVMNHYYYHLSTHLAAFPRCTLQKQGLRCLLSTEPVLLHSRTNLLTTVLKHPNYSTDLFISEKAPNPLTKTIHTPCNIIFQTAHYICDEALVS